VSREVFYRWLKENPELAEAREASLGVEEKDLVDMLWKNAESGNVAAQIFLLKARHHYRDNSPVADQTAVQVNITLPGASKLDEYKARIIAEQPELVKRIEREERNDGIDIDRA
jgi:hypothetical protein